MEKNEKVLNENLRAGESVLWKGQPLPFGLLDGKDGKKVLRQWILSVLGIGVLIYLYTRQSGYSMTTVGVMAFIMLVLIVSPILSYRKLKAQSYYITNERAILVAGNGDFRAIELSEIDDQKIMPLQPSGCCLVLGSSLFEEGDKQLRWRALNPKVESGASGLSKVQGLVFYNVGHAEEEIRFLHAQE